jgi:amidase/nitrilase
VERHLGGKSADPGSRECDIEPAIREYAIENQVFVVSSSWYLPESEIPRELAREMKYNLAAGGSCIVNPAGLFVKGPVFGEETIVFADIDQEERRLAKAYFDCLGHYARFDLLNLTIRDEAWTPGGPRRIAALPVPARGLAGEDAE